MSASFPAGVYSPRTKANKTGVVYSASKATLIYAEDIQALDAEIVAVETELGANPKGASASVSARFTTDESNISEKFPTAGGTFTGKIVEAVSALSDGATPALDASLGNIFTLSAGGDRTIAVPSNASAGQKIIIRHYASGGARTLALNTGANGFRFGSDITALTQTASGKTDYIGCIWNAADSKWDVVAYIKGF